MNIIDWYSEAVGDDSENAVAVKSGIGQTTINRQLKTGKLTPEVVVAVARAYDKSPLAGLVLLGLITEQDIKRHRVDVILRKISDRHIADEVWRRMQDGRMDENGNPLDESDPDPKDFPSLSVVPDIKAAKRKDGRRASVEGAEGSTP